MKNISEKNPLVSVVMPVYNGERYIAEAIESIENQSYKNWELIIIDDASTDGTVDILRTKSINTKIKILRQQNQGGQARGRNIGIEASQGKYIALMDADDISLPQRLEREVAYMEKHPDVALVGSWVKILEKENEKTEIYKAETSSEKIKTGLMFNTMIVNSSIMVRKDFLAQHKISYDPSFPHSEDYAFLVEIANHGKIRNIPEPLVIYRKHDSNVSITHKKIQSEGAQKIREKIFKNLGLESENKDSASQTISEYFELLKKIKTANKIHKIYNKRILDLTLENRLRNILYPNLSFKTALFFLFHPIRLSPYHLLLSTKLMAKLLLN